jgi:hypothetical protein
MQTTLDAAQIKTLFKEAITEVLEERRDLLSDAIEDAIEDAALSRAIEAEANSTSVSREDVFAALTSGA